jgi:uncharacterized membrane protein
MSLATLILSGWHWLLPTAGVMGLALVLLMWSYRSTPSGWVRWLCLGLKVLGIAGLGLCLLEPLWSGQRARPGANLFAVVADNSQRLQIKDQGATQSRGEFLRELLNPSASGWQTKLEESFEVRRYLFDARLQTTKDFADVAFDGRASAMGGALRTLKERFHGRPLAGVLLLTDGNATDLRGAPDLAGSPPVYPVVIGSQDPVKDIAMQEVHATRTDFEDAPVSVQADVTASGYRGASVVAQVFDVAGKKVSEQKLQARKDNDLLAFRFQLKPEKPGISFYRVRARLAGEEGMADRADATSEATLANNSRVLAVDRGHGPYRILYVSGRPNWEFKFLNRAVQEDDQLDMVGLIRVAKREPKFTFLGRAGETSNPLFRGFGNQAADEVQRYDQPVLVRINPRDGFELRGGFPRTAEELYAYHAVIVDDLEAEFFTPDQALLVQRFVSERGGGYLMLGGMETFQQGKYQRTPIGDMLPVYLDRTEETKAKGPYHLTLTPEGLLQSWARLRDNEAAEKARIESVAPFHVLNAVREVKPGASIIAKASDAAGKTYPALVVQRFGRGRTAAFTLGDVWHWGLHDEEAHQDMDKGWRQLMRWLVTDAPNRVELAAEHQNQDENGAVTLEVRARDAKFQPLDNAAISLEVRPVMGEASGAQTNAIRLQAEASTTEPGLYRASYVPRATGGYRASVTVTNTEGEEVGRAESGWSNDLAADEFRSLKPNLGLLEEIARKTGGEVIAANELEQFARRLPQRRAPVMESWSRPLWHTPAMFGFALACFLGEWGVRRWKGMA